MADYIYVTDYTPLIRLSDLAYPVYFPQVRRENNNVSFPIPCRDDILEPYGYVPVLESVPPEGDVVTEITPVQGEDGRFYKAYSVRSYTEDELIEFKRNKIQNASMYYANDLSVGFKVSYNGKDYRVLFTTADMAYYSLVVSLPDRYLTVNVRLLDGALYELPREEALEIYATVLDKFDQFNDTYFSFLSAIHQAASAADMPEDMYTFLPQ